MILTPGFLLSAEAGRPYADALPADGLIVALRTDPRLLFASAHRHLAARIYALLDGPLTAAGRRADPLHRAIDPFGIGGAGPSLGGKIAAMVAAEDGRIRAALLLDPIDADPPGESARSLPPRTPERMADLRVPVLVIGAELGGVAPPSTVCRKTRTAAASSRLRTLPRSKSRSSEPITPP